MSGMSKKPTEADAVRNGDKCEVIGGTHAGKAGTVQDRNVSKTGQVTITVQQSNGERFKTLARNVAVKRTAKK